MTHYIEKRKKQVMTYLMLYYQKNDYMPTLREIGREAFVGEKLTAERVRQILLEMEKDGKIRVIRNKLRGIELLIK